MTAAKAFNIMLLLPWAIAVLPALKVLLRRPLASLAIILFAAGALPVPTAIMNVKHCGDWRPRGGTTHHRWQWKTIPLFGPGH